MESSKDETAPRPAAEELVSGLLGLMKKYSYDEFARGMREALVVSRAQRPGVHSDELRGLAAVVRALDEEGALTVSAALKEAARIHGSVNAAALVFWGYSDRIAEAAQGLFDCDSGFDEKSLRALEDLVWQTPIKGQPT